MAAMRRSLQCAVATLALVLLGSDQTLASVIQSAALEASKELFYEYQLQMEMSMSMEYYPCYHYSKKGSKSSSSEKYYEYYYYYDEEGHMHAHEHEHVDEHHYHLVGHHHQPHPNHPPPKYDKKKCKEMKIYKGSKSSKSSKGKGYPPKSKYSKGYYGKGKGIYLPTSQPSNGLSGQPTKMPGQTTQPGDTGIPTTPGPTDGSPIVQQLSPFEIAYTIAQTDIPTISDYDGVTALTSRYIDESFNLTLGTMAMVDYEASTTIRTGEDFNLNQPVQVFYLTNVTFSSSSGSIPSVTELDLLLDDFFTTNSDAYLALLQELENNLFSTTSAFTFQKNTNSAEQDPSPGPLGGNNAGGGSSGGGGGIGTADVGNSNTMSGTSTNPGDPTSLTAAKTAGIAVAAGAGGFVVIITALMMYRRRHASDEDENLVKYVGEEQDGHMTVAGDTFTGTISVDSRSIRQQTEDGTVTTTPGDPNWEGYAYSTAKFRTSSPSGSSSEGHDSDGSDSTHGSGITGASAPSIRPNLETVDL